MTALYLTNDCSIFNPWLHCIWPMTAVYLTRDCTVFDLWLHCIWPLTALYLALDCTVFDLWLHWIWPLTALYLTFDCTVFDPWLHCIWPLTALYLTLDCTVFDPQLHGLCCSLHLHPGGVLQRGFQSPDGHQRGNGAHRSRQLYPPDVGVIFVDFCIMLCQLDTWMWIAIFGQRQRRPCRSFRLKKLACCVCKAEPSRLMYLILTFSKRETLSRQCRSFPPNKSVWFSIKAESSWLTCLTVCKWTEELRKRISAGTAKRKSGMLEGWRVDDQLRRDVKCVWHWNAWHDVFCCALPFPLSAGLACDAALKCLTWRVLPCSPFCTAFCCAVPFALSVRLAYDAGLKCIACVFLFNTFRTICQTCLWCRVKMPGMTCFCRAVPFALFCCTFCTICQIGLWCIVEMPYMCFPGQYLLYYLSDRLAVQGWNALH